MNFKLMKGIFYLGAFGICCYELGKTIGHQEGVTKGTVNTVVEFHKLVTEVNKDRKERHVARNRGQGFDPDPEVIFETDTEALAALKHLQDMIKKYGFVTVADFMKECACPPGDYRHDKWGWFDLEAVTPRRVRNGWLLNLPKSSLID